MKILLIKPPLRGFYHEIGRHTPIGLAYLSSVLREAGHQTAIFDALAFVEDNHVIDEPTAIERHKLAIHPRWTHLLHWGARWERIDEAIAREAPDVVGISCMFSPYYESAYEVARRARRLLPRARILLGGPHATVAPRHVLAVPEIDVAVLGEAERTVVEIAARIEHGQQLLGAAGAAFRCGEGWCGCATAGDPHVQEHEEWIQDLDALPFPAADQLDFARYGDATALITSRGCPFSCTFCTVHATVGRKFRARTPGNVVDEIERYTRLGVRRFLVEDDNFTFDTERVLRICDEILRRKLDVELRLPNGITVVKLTQELVERMTAAGFTNLFLGLETTDPARLKAIAKGFTSLEQVRESAGWFAAHGADVSASLIVGLPGQEVAEVARDVRALLECGIKFWSNPFYPIPGSPDYRRCVERGVIDESTDYALFDQYNFAVGSDRFSPGELYWTWIITQAIAQWPGYLREARGLAPRAALQALIDYARGGDVFEVPARPVSLGGGADLPSFELDAESCFCSLHRLHPRAGSHRGMCVFGGDVIAAALMLASGRPISAREDVCRLDGAAARCAFSTSPGSPGWEIVQQFLEVMRAPDLHLAVTA